MKKSSSDDKSLLMPVVMSGIGILVIMNPLIPTGFDVVFTVAYIVLGVALLIAVFVIASWLVSSDRVHLSPKKRSHHSDVQSR